MNKQLLFSAILLNLSSNIFCMFGMAQKMRSALPIKTALPNAIRLASTPQRVLMPKRTLIYSVNDWRYAGHYDHYREAVDVDSYIRPSLGSLCRLFAAIKVSKYSAPTYPLIPELTNRMYFARLRYLGLFGRNLDDPRYFFFENSNDMKHIIDAIKEGEEIACGGWATLDRDGRLFRYKNQAFREGSWGEYNEDKSVRGIHTKKPANKIEFYAVPTNKTS